MVLAFTLILACDIVVDYQNHMGQVSAPVFNPDAVPGDYFDVTVSTATAELVLDIQLTAVYLFLETEKFMQGQYKFIKT